MIYLIYARIPEELWAMKLRFVVHDAYQYDIRSRMVNKIEVEEYVGIYAWTRKKKFLKEFLQNREGAKDMYFVVEMDEDDVDINTMHELLELRHYYVPRSNIEDPGSTSYRGMNTITDDINDMSFSSLTVGMLEDPSNHGIEILSNASELHTIIPDGDLMINSLLDDIITCDYSAFTTELIDALDIIGYCNEFDDMYGANEDGELLRFYGCMERRDYNAHYGKTTLGHTLYPRIFDSFYFVYMMVFYEMFVGYKDGQSIPFTLMH